MRKAVELQQQRVQEELKSYSERAAQKKPSFRELYNKRIQELEQTCTPLHFLNSRLVFLSLHLQTAFPSTTFYYVLNIA